MQLSQKAEIKDAIDVLLYHIRNRIELDQLTFRRYLNNFNKVSSEPLKLMLLGLSYGAINDYKNAVPFLKEAATYKDEMMAINYLFVLGNTSDFRFYTEECKRLAREYNSFKLCVLAAHISFATGNIQDFNFFIKKAISLTPDKDVARELEMSSNNHIKKMERFYLITDLSNADIEELLQCTIDIANRHNIPYLGVEFYVDRDDCEAAIIIEVLTMNEDLISEMDIEIACTISMNEKYSDKKLTSWYRGKKDKVYAI
ncbi:hypothetical protein [Arsenophonus sp.]|uniref:hypothetical protein n=1 Tax=Arsenophonus sp. TaxID=1872640 RepID=UPI0038792ADF